MMHEPLDQEVYNSLHIQRPSRGAHTEQHDHKTHSGGPQSSDHITNDYSTRATPAPRLRALALLLTPSLA
jgi:hypothetical protein